MPEPAAITSLRSEIPNEPETRAQPITQINSIKPGDPIPIEMLRETEPDRNGDIRATIWQSLSALPPEKAQEAYLLIKDVQPHVEDEIALEVLRAYRHHIFSKSSDSADSAPRLPKEDETKVMRGAVAAYFTKLYASRLH
ncbi:MAG: hypothetical protein E6Q58_04395 [Niabella sp.]|nr:MAG: hypothetical protein E6Q58_04395 [Niabella sp.]